MQVILREHSLRESSCLIMSHLRNSVLDDSSFFKIGGAPEERRSLVVRFAGDHPDQLARTCVGSQSDCLFVYGPEQIHQGDFFEMGQVHGNLGAVAGF